jgi:hypothetical protein
MNTCPNKTDPAWIKLEAAFGEKVAMGYFMAWDENLPTVQEVDNFIAVAKNIIKNNNKSVDNTIQEMSELIDEAKFVDLVKPINEYFTVINKQVNSISRLSNTRLKELFTEGNVKKLFVLQELLKDANNLSDEVDADQRRAIALVRAIFQIEHLTDLMIKDIEEIIKDEENALENIPLLESYITTAKTWHTMLQEITKIKFPYGSKIDAKASSVISKIEKVEKSVIDNDKSGIIKILKAVLTPFSLKFSKSYKDEIEREEKLLARQVEKNQTEKVEQTKKRIKDLKEQEKALDFENKENILSFLRGEKGGSGFLNNSLRAYRDSTNPTVLGFITYVKNIIDNAGYKALQFNLKLEKKIAGLLTNMERLNPEIVGKALTFVDQIIGPDGIAEGVLTFLNPWKNYRADYGLLKNKENELKDTFLKDRSKENEENYLKAKKDRIEFEENYMHREYTEEFYEKYKLFDDVIGQELKKDIDLIWKNIRDLDTSVGDMVPTQEDLDAKESYLRDYALLGNMNNLDGTEKQGIEKDKAERMMQVRKLNSEIYEWIDNWTFYEKSKQNYSIYLEASLGLNPKTKEFDLAMEKWVKENTRQVINDTFYEEREAIIKEINYLLSKIKNEENLDIKELWKTITGVTYGLRDENNQPIGSLISEKNALKIKTAEEEIQRIKDEVKLSSGLTKVEWEIFKELLQSAKDGTITEEEDADLYEYQKRIIKAKSEGLSSQQKERLYELFDQLADIQKNIPTTYYVEIFNNIVSSFASGVVLNDQGEILEEDEEGNKIWIPVLQSNTLNTLLENKSFKKWFDLNHIKSEKYNKETSSMEEIWKRTYQWNKITPVETRFFDTKPARKYAYRKVKNEFNEIEDLREEKAKGSLGLTERKRLKVLEIKEKRGLLKSYITKKIIGETVDNLGNFLPNANKSKSVKYKNQAYFDLVESKDSTKQRHSKLLKIYTDSLLEAQEDSPYSAKLWLAVPREQKTSVENKVDAISSVKNSLRRPLSIPKEIWNRIKMFWNSLVDFNQTEEGLPFESIDENEFNFMEKYKSEYIKVPIKYTGKLDIDSVSYDLFRSISKYNSSTELNRVLIDALPITKALQRVMDEQGELPKAKKDRHDTTKDAIRRIIARNFEGKSANLDFIKLGKSGKFFIGGLNFMKKISSLALIKLNYKAAIANLVNGTVQNWINSDNELYSTGAFAKSSITYASWFFPQLQKDYIQNKLGERNLAVQMVEYWTPIQGTDPANLVGERASSSKIVDLANLNPLLNFREWSEFYLQSRTWLATLEHTKVEQKQADGSLKTINLLDAYELNSEGNLALKKGIDKKWEVGGEYFQRLKNKIHALNRRIHGNYNSFDKTKLETYAWGSVFFYLKKYFIDTLTNRLGAEGTVKEYLTFNGRDYLNGNPRGYYYQTIQAHVKLAQRGLNNWDLATPQEKQAVAKSLKEASIVLSSLLLMGLMGYSGDDKNKKKQLQKYSWIELQTLYQLNRLYIENIGYVNPSNYLNNIFSLSIATGLQKWLDFLTSFISQSEYASTTRDSHGRILHKKHEKKWKSNLLNVTGIKPLVDFTLSPDENLKNYNRGIGRTPF